MLLILGLLGFMPVRSAIGQSRAIVVYVEGPDANVARKAVIDGLPAGTTIAEDQAFRRELARQGQKKPFGRHVDSHAVDRVRRAANAVGASAVLLVRVRKADPRTALVLIVDPSGTAGADREMHFRANLKDEDQDELRRSLGQFAAEEPTSSARESAEVPSPPAPSSDASQAGRTAQADLSPAPPPATPPTGNAMTPRDAPPVPMAPEAISRPGASNASAVATSLVDVALSGGVAGRRFEYRNGIAPSPSVLSKPAMPAFGVNAELFPLAGAENLWGDVGFVGEYLAILSSDFAGIYPTGYGAGMRFRIHPGASPPVLLSLDGEYEFIRFGAEDAGRSRVPDVTYRALRTAADARIPIGRFSILAGTALRTTIDPSGISQQFYGSPSGFGFDAHGGSTFVFLPHFEARLIASYTRYSFSFGPPPGATFGSGNAIDQLFGVSLGAAYVH